MLCVSVLTPLSDFQLFKSLFSSPSQASFPPFVPSLIADGMNEADLCLNAFFFFAILDPVELECAGFQWCGLF